MGNLRCAVTGAVIKPQEDVVLKSVYDKDKAKPEPKAKKEKKKK